MKTMLKIFLISSISLNSFAQVTYLEKNKPAPYTGYLFTPEKTIEVKNDLIDLETQKKLNKNYRKKIDLQIKKIKLREEQIDYYKARNHQLHTDIDSIKRVNNYERAGWFVLGILATSLAIKGAQELK